VFSEKQGTEFSRIM